MDDADLRGTDEGLGAGDRKAERIILGQPASLQSFGLFTWLPPELQHAIWKLSIPVPSINFFQVHPNSTDEFLAHGIMGFTSQVSPTDNDQQVDAQIERVPSKLAPVVWWPRADISRGTQMTKEKLTISKVSKASLESVQRLDRKLDLISLRSKSAGGSANAAFSVSCNSDLACFRYLHLDLYRTEVNLRAVFPGKIKDKFKFRRVALRFEREWNTPAKQGFCPRDHMVHGKANSNVVKTVRPFHVYQYLARHFPHLEEVWFLDYLMLPKITGESLQRRKENIHKACLRSFRAKDRTFYAADTKHWELKPQVQDVVIWVQEHYVQYATKSKLSRHSRPEDVHFGVLGCIWDISLELPDRTLPQPPEPQHRVPGARTWRKRRAAKQPLAQHPRRLKLEAERSNYTVMERQVGTEEGNLLFGNGRLEGYVFDFDQSFESFRFLGHATNGGQFP